MTPIFHISNHA